MDPSSIMEKLLTNYTSYGKDDDGRCQRHMYVMQNMPNLALAEPYIFAACKHYQKEYPGSRFAHECPTARECFSWLTYVSLMQKLPLTIGTQDFIILGNVHWSVDTG